MADDFVTINPWVILPFGILLALIALGPTVFPAFWSRQYPRIVVGLTLVPVFYYFFGLHTPGRVVAALHEYVSFMALIGSLYVVAGGIHFQMRGTATPLGNVGFLLVGAILANILGTTGASMLLIRPWLRMNRDRIAAHHVVFFIFIVSNIGGCLTPIGDPPLFLGYLAGVPFWWVAQHCFLPWLTAVGILLLMFWIVDYRSRQCPAKIAMPIQGPSEWQFSGGNNLFFLAVILGAVFIHDPPFLREGLMLAAALGSYFTTAKATHQANRFDFHPLQEVAILFVGIFATMMPALDFLETYGSALNEVSTGGLFWSSGLLSSVLDNAPTYLCFLKVISVRYANGEASLAAYLTHPQFSSYLASISVGAVFFGANTYIANGPNFMVKAIAEAEGAPTPSFMGYIWRFALPCMLPVLLVVWRLFFWH